MKHVLREHAGFTLLEVLVAMAIISLGLIGVFGSLNQMLGATSLLRDKTLATWIATDRITEMRVNGEYPDAGERDDVVEMAGVEWLYTIKVSKIPDMSMRRLDVSVGFADDPDSTVATVVGFLPQPQATGENDTVRRFGEGYEPLDPNADYASEALQ
ncbi:MAG: type II secretion system minor pseudopilin GspI [Gammaproteobacteria bacterium]|nr:type II secretion system minor pseudopilin GspI [Gammaproteobacteria bacterium]